MSSDRPAARRRRSEDSYEPQKVFDAMLTSPISWPGKTIRLERNSLLDYRNRITSAHPAVAELYHENSKLFREMAGELAVGMTNPQELRQAFLIRRGAVVGMSGASQVLMEPAWRKLLSSLSTSVARELFYAVEVRIVADGSLGWHEPVSDTVSLLKSLRRDEVAALKEAAGILTSDPWDGETPLIALVGSFARNAFLFGERGYRRSLLEAGRISQEVTRLGQECGLQIRPLYEFADRQVDVLMEVDGVEQGTLVLFVGSALE